MPVINRLRAVVANDGGSMQSNIQKAQRYENALKKSGFSYEELQVGATANGIVFFISTKDPKSYTKFLTFAKRYFSTVSPYKGKDSNGDPTFIISGYK